MILDGHVHVGPWRYKDFLGRATTFEETADVLAACGIDGALVMPTDEADNVGLLGAVAAYRGPMQFFVAAWADPSAPAAAAAAIDALGAGVRAIKIHPTLARLPITDAAWTPFLDLAARRRIPAIVHCGRWQAMAGHAIALDLAGRRPDVTFVLSHLGGDAPPLSLACAERIARERLANVHLGTESVREFWHLRRVADLVSASRLLFGSDFNLGHPKSYLAVIEAAGFTPAEREAVLGENLLRLLGETR